MPEFNKLLMRQAQKYLGGADKIPEEYLAFMNAVSESYNHYEKDHRLLERSIELSSAEMIELTEQLRNESEELRKAHEVLKATESLRLEKLLDQEKINNLKEITVAVIDAQERQRSGFAAELHDNINQILATSKLYLDTAIRNEDRRLLLMTESKKFINTAIEEIRYLCKSLFPPSLTESTLVGALEDLIRNINKLDTIKITTHWENIDPSMICEKTKLTIFRIVQEQLNNVLKHAKAQRVLISLIQCHEGFRLSIKDDGIGFDTKQKNHGSGLHNILSRANSFKGEMTINSEPGAGCEMQVFLYHDQEMLQQKIAS